MGPYLETAVVAALLLMTLWASSVAYALRNVSRSRLARRLVQGDPRRWLDWLDANEVELYATTAFARFALSFATLLGVALRFVPDDAPASELPLLDLAQACGWSFALLLLFGVCVPNALARHAPEAIVAASLRPLRVLCGVLYPFNRLAAGIDFIVKRLLGKHESDEVEPQSRAEEEILAAVNEGEFQGAVDGSQKEMIASVFELHDTTVEALMTPRTEIVALPADASYSQVRDVIISGGHSRIPVYADTLDEIIGVLYAKDLLGLRSPDEFNLRRLLRTVPYVPMSKKPSDLLNELRQAKVHMAIVLDEYGGTAGLVTIEDIIEQIVGEIADEYDQPEPPPIQRLSEHEIEVNGWVHISEVATELGAGLPEDGDYETVGGFVCGRLGRIPAAGEELVHDNVHFRVVDADARRVKRLRISVTHDAAVTPPPSG